MFNVIESRLYQRKPAGNVKLVSVHVSPAYAISVNELVKPVNISKPVCSSNATQRNVCNASSVSQLIKPLNVSKPVYSSKAAKCNVCNAGSVSKLIEPLNVSKTVCSNNTVSNFISVCHSVKPARKLIDVNRKCPHEQLVNNKNSGQHDFTKSFGAMNILIMSIYFY